MRTYRHKPEVWDKATCERASRYVAKDGLGTKYPWPGYIGCHYGVTRYNGGCWRDDKWWKGEDRPLPKVAEGYVIIHVRTWGYRIVREGG